MQKSMVASVVTTIANLAAALAIVVPAAACDHFSGELTVRIENAPDDAVVLALVENSAGGLSPGLAIDIADGGGCVAKNLEASSEQALEPLQVFAIEADDFAIRFDESLPTGPLSLVAFVDADDDGALDVAADAALAITTERCIGATKKASDAGALTLIEVSVYDDNESSGDDFGPIARDDAGGDSVVFDAEATGWLFDLVP